MHPGFNLSFIDPSAAGYGTYPPDPYATNMPHQPQTEEFARPNPLYVINGNPGSLMISSRKRQREDEGWYIESPSQNRLPMVTVPSAFQLTAQDGTLLDLAVAVNYLHGKINALQDTHDELIQERLNDSEKVKGLEETIAQLRTEIEELRNIPTQTGQSKPRNTPLVVIGF